MCEQDQMDRIELCWNWIESKSNLAPSANTPLLHITVASNLENSLQEGIYIYIYART